MLEQLDELIIKLEVFRQSLANQIGVVHGGPVILDDTKEMSAGERDRIVEEILSNAHRQQVRRCEQEAGDMI